MTIDIRRQVTTVEKVHHDGGPPLDRPIRRGWCASVIANPFAGKHVEELIPFMDSLEPLAHDMTFELLVALGATPPIIESYGKGAIIGSEGEMEHAAMWHAPAGAGIRRALSAGDAAVLGSMKIGPTGCTLDLSIGNMDVGNVRSHYDSIAVTVGDAPRPRELVLVVALATGGRPHSRLGSLVSAEEARQRSGRA
jgi:hypothetical protein